MTSRPEVALVVATTILCLALLLTPIAPAMDLPQHLAMAADLRRLWDNDPITSTDLVVNLATHNAGFHLFVAALGRWIPIEIAGRIFLALCPAVLVLAVHRCLVELALPTWRALLVIPIALGFTFCWGFVNFWMGTSLVWLGLALVLGQFRELKVWRAIALAALSAALSLNHVLAMLGLAVMAAAAGLEHIARPAVRPRTTRDGLAAIATVALAGAPLLVGCLWDLHVMFAHTGETPDAYTREATHWFSPSPLWKLALLGTLCGGLFRTFLDIAIAWIVIVVIIAAFVFAWRDRASRDAPAHDARAPRVLVFPFVVVTIAYLAIPSVFASTHQVFQRFAQWMVIAAITAVPVSSLADRKLTPWAVALSMSSAVLTALHLAAYTVEIRGLDETLAMLPDGARITGVIEEPRTASIRQAGLVHIAAMHRVRQHGADPFMFARYMGPPVVFKRGHEPPYPDPSWEWEPERFDPQSSVARHYPWVLVRTAWAEEPSLSMQVRLFGNEPVHLISRHDRWALFARNSVVSPSVSQ